MQISLMVRSLIVFSVVFTVFYLIAFTWLYNYSAALIRANLANIPNLPPNLNAEQIIVATQAHLQSIALPVYLVTFSVIFLVVMGISYRVTRPLERMTQFALRVSAGDYSEPPPPTVRLLGRDEIDVLSDVFLSMVKQVAARETSLKQQVQQLQIVVDNKKKVEDVSEITDSDFFNKLKVRAQEIRAKNLTDGAAQA
jgi:HAMP domain-containing protein